VTLFLHGVVRAGHPCPHRVVTWADLAMVVTDVQLGQDAQLAILSELVLAGPVVPLRYGCTAADEDAVRTDTLAASATRLRADLDRLDGVTELHAYLRFNEEDALQAMFDEQWRGGQDPSTDVRLDEHVAHRLVAWRRARSDALLSPISAAARAEVRLPDRDHAEERRAFLLPHKEVEPARAVIGALRILAGVATECVGPLPAYHFLTVPAGTPSSGSCR
jgi:gas vesicle protein GvpL/GvpF